jgi:hypothetical protein
MLINFYNVFSGTCKENEFKCADGSKCISKLSTCDDVKDCDDGSDEIECKSK